MLTLSRAITPLCNSLLLDLVKNILYHQMNLLLNAVNACTIEAKTTNFSTLCNIIKSLVEIKSLPLDQICVELLVINKYVALFL